MFTAHIYFVFLVLILFIPDICIPAITGAVHCKDIVIVSSNYILQARHLHVHDRKVYVKMNAVKQFTLQSAYLALRHRARLTSHVFIENILRIYAYKFLNLYRIALFSNKIINTVIPFAFGGTKCQAAN